MPYQPKQCAKCGSYRIEEYAEMVEGDCGNCGHPIPAAIRKVARARRKRRDAKQKAATLHRIECIVSLLAPDFTATRRRAFSVGLIQQLRL